jgi:superfamily II DNA or RNA helicase
LLWYDSNVFKDFGLVIIDEMHHLAAKTLSKVLPKIPARYILGISATPDRGDGLEFLLYWLAGPTSFVYKRLPEITGLSHTVLVHQHIFRGGAEKEVFNVGGKLGFASMVSALAKEEARNTFLLQIIKYLTKDGMNRRKILIVTSIVNHAKFLSDTLQCTMINGGCPSYLVAKAKSPECKLVVATYQFLEEGFDDPLIDTLILALPRSKIQQVVGRCERTYEGKLTPIVIDIIDPFSIFQAMSWKRKSFYDSRGFKLLMQ